MSRFRAIKRLAPGVEFELTQDGTNGNMPYISRWDSQDPQPAEQAILDEIAAIEAEDTAAIEAASTLRSNILALANSSVGTVVNSLTLAQTRALVAILLWKAGALNDSLEIKPLAEWVK